MMKFFLDANIPYSSIKKFEELHLDAIHARDVGFSQADDDEIMKYAAMERRILVTKDRGFANIIRFPPSSHNGIIIVRFPYFFNASRFADSLGEFLSAVDLRMLEDAITVARVGRYRIRRLP